MKLETAIQNAYQILQKNDINIKIKNEFIFIFNILRIKLISIILNVLVNSI